MMRDTCCKGFSEATWEFSNRELFQGLVMFCTSLNLPET